jgi:hypothetical protein
MISCKPSHHAGELKDRHLACVTDQNLPNLRGRRVSDGNRDGNLSVSNRTEAASGGPTSSDS